MPAVVRLHLLLPDLWRRPRHRNILLRQLQVCLIPVLFRIGFSVILTGFSNFASYFSCHNHCLKIFNCIVRYFVTIFCICWKQAAVLLRSTSAYCLCRRYKVFKRFSLPLQFSTFLFPYLTTNLDFFSVGPNASLRPVLQVKLYYCYYLFHCYRCLHCLCFIAVFFHCCWSFIVVVIFLCSYLCCTERCCIFPFNYLPFVSHCYLKA